MPLEIAVFLIKRNYNSIETFISEIKCSAEFYVSVVLQRNILSILLAQWHKLSQIPKLAFINTQNMIDLKYVCPL